MKLNKQFLVVLMSILMLLILTSSVYSWGLLPARQLAPFTTDVQQLDISIKNTDFSEGYFSVDFSGDLASYARYSGGTVYVSADQESYTIPFSLALPETLEPGKRTLKVVLKEIPANNNGGTLDSLLTLVGEVVVNAPQAGNYVSAQLFIDAKSSSQAVPLTITLLNKGEDAVVVYADVEILSPTNQKIASWTSDKIILDYLGNSKIETTWSDNKNSGLYYAQVTLHYGDKFQVLRKEFIIGNKEVISESISSNNFNLGDIAPLDILVHNMWNDVMDDVFAEIFVLEEDGSLVQSFKSVPEDIFANSKKNLVAYWDTKNLLVGNYDLNVLVNYPGGQTQKQYPVAVSLDKLQVDNQLTGQVIDDSSDSKGGNNSLMIILLIVLIVSNVIIILYFKRMKKGSKKSNDKGGKS